jgi:hypothetical protein
VMVERKRPNDIVGKATRVIKFDGGIARFIDQRMHIPSLATHHTPPPPSPPSQQNALAICMPAKGYTRKKEENQELYVAVLYKTLENFQPTLC